MKRELYNTQITANASGASSSILLTPGHAWNVFVTSASGMDVDLQASSDNVVGTFLNVSGGNFTSNGVQEINGGLYIRAYLNSYVANVTILAKKA